MVRVDDVEGLFQPQRFCDSPQIPNSINLWLYSSFGKETDCCWLQGEQGSLCQHRRSITVTALMDYWCSNSLYPDHSMEAAIKSKLACLALQLVAGDEFICCINKLRKLYGWVVCVTVLWKIFPLSFYTELVNIQRLCDMQRHAGRKGVTCLALECWNMELVVFVTDVGFEVPKQILGDEKFVLLSMSSRHVPAIVGLDIVRTSNTLLGCSTGAVV